jgi:hypothetical protein
LLLAVEFPQLFFAPLQLEAQLFDTLFIGRESHEDSFFDAGHFGSSLLEDITVFLCSDNLIDFSFGTVALGIITSLGLSLKRFHGKISWNKLYVKLFIWKRFTWQSS